ncbi:nucleobindin-2 isoform X3 [Patella vulgata]|uniref:nucleobindin-2 isoform X3 n=1 Tax=Patella vulgata TaxID=6465 RepID=UPI00217FDB6D|nr:nucleobindin-2 isoform X3 [Patella vulgata]
MIPKLITTAVASIVLLYVLNISGKPVAPSKPVEANSKDEEVVNNTGLEYDRYLREVVSVLEEDDDFRKKLEAANVSEIKDGSIARNLEFVGNHIRTKLDEIKRREVERLQELARLKMRTMKGTQVLHNIAYHGGAIKDFKMPGHLDVMNPHSFEMKDLEHLIKKTTTDLEELDKQRREEFKEYEMEKQYEEKEKLSHLSPEEQKKEQARLEELKKKHGKHEKVNHPASKDQFEEVWENQDHLDKEDFEPRTFFNLHDTNSDGVWTINEVEALLQVELDKVYGEKDQEEDDPIERSEEMNRMREHIFTEIDQDRNFMITQEEFLAYTGPKGENKQFEENDEWKTLDNEELFDDKEYQDFMNEHHRQQQQQQLNEEHEGYGYDDRDSEHEDVHPNVQNMQIPPGSPQDLHLQQQQQILAAQQQQLHQQQQAQFAQQQAQQHLQQQQAQFAQQQAQQQFAAAQQQQLHQQGQGIQQGVPAQGMQGSPVQQQGLHGQQPPVQQQQQQQVPVQQQGVPVQQQQGVPVQQQQVPVQQQQQQQQAPVQQQQQQVPVQQQQQQQVPVQQQQVPVQNAQPNQGHPNQV